MCADSPAPYRNGPRGLDHLVLAGRDLDRLAKFYSDIGFTVGGRNRHPWGTENHIVQFDGVFLELIGIGAGAQIPERRDGHYSFGGFVRDYLAGGEGMAMLVLESRDATADNQAFREARIGGFEPFFFERKGVNAAGREVRVAFTLAFAEMAHAPRAGFFLCQQHEPQNFWNPAVQTHANGVTGVHSVTLVADDPSDLHEFLGAFTGQRAMRATSFGLEIDTGRGLVEVLSPQAFTYRFGQEAPVQAGRGPQFAAVTFRTGGTARLTRRLTESSVPLRDHAGLLTIPPVFDHGLLLAFTSG